jgi:hypothetical protein
MAAASKCKKKTKHWSFTTMISKFQKELDDQRYHQRRNAQAIKSHTKTRINLYFKMRMDVDQIKNLPENRKERRLTPKRPVVLG